MNEKSLKRLLILNLILNVIIIAGFLFGTLALADSNGIWTRAQDIIAGTFGADQGGGNFTFPSGVEVKGNMKLDNNICLNGICHKNWTTICQSWVTKNSVNK